MGARPTMLLAYLLMSLRIFAASADNAETRRVLDSRLTAAEQQAADASGDPYAWRQRPKQEAARTPATASIPSSVSPGRMGLPGDYDFECPVQMEVQGEAFQCGLPHSVPATTIILQQKGLNDRDPNACARYARVIVAVERGGAGEFAPISDAVTPLVEQEFGEALHMQLLVEASALAPGLSLIRWQGTQTRKVGNANAVQASYVRQTRENQPVQVSILLVQNYDCCYRITLSHRENETEWPPVFEAFLNSIVFTPRGAVPTEQATQGAAIGPIASISQSRLNWLLPSGLLGLVLYGMAGAFLGFILNMVFFRRRRAPRWLATILCVLLAMPLYLGLVLLGQRLAGSTGYDSASQIVGMRATTRSGMLVWFLWMTLARVGTRKRGAKPSGADSEVLAAVSPTTSPGAPGSPAVTTASAVASAGTGMRPDGVGDEAVLRQPPDRRSPTSARQRVGAWRNGLNLAQRIVLSITGSGFICMLACGAGVIAGIDTSEIDESWLLWLVTILSLGVSNLWVFKTLPPSR